MKANHHSLKYKMQAQPNKTYKDLRQKQKSKISNWMFQMVCEYYDEHSAMPEGEAAEQITTKIYDKITSLAIWIPYDEVYHVFLSKLPRYEARITEAPSPMPEQAPRRNETIPSRPKKKGGSNKVCPIVVGK